MSGKYIMASVGFGGVNIPSDVATVQYLLNCVPISHGGPINELRIDGQAGMMTIEAIGRFQYSQFGWADKRVDPETAGGITLTELKKYDPLPFAAPSVPRFNSPANRPLPGKGVLRGKKHSGGPGRPATAAELAFEPPVFVPWGKRFGKKHSGL